MFRPRARGSDPERHQIPWARPTPCVLLLVLGLVLAPTISPVTSTDPRPEQRVEGARVSPRAVLRQLADTEDDLVRAAADGLTQLQRRSSAGDGEYLRDWRWHRQGVECFRCDMGPTVTAAALAGMTRDRRYTLLAVRTMDRALADHQTPSGAFGLVRSGRPRPDDIETALFAMHLGLSVQLMGTQLPAAERRRWVRALCRAVDWLYHHGNYAWYTNGNISLGNAVAAGLAWRLTGDPHFRHIYELGLRFVEHPPQDRWPGYGLVVTRRPHRPDGADGAAYLTETGAGGTGFDPEYTSVQADFAAVLALVVREREPLRLANMLANQVMTRVDTHEWTLDTSRGTRHTEAGRWVDFTDSFLTTLTLLGRSDLARLALAESRSQIRHAVTWGEDGGASIYEMWGSQLAPLLYDLAQLHRSLATVEPPRRSAPPARLRKPPVLGAASS